MRCITSIFNVTGIILFLSYSIKCSMLCLVPIAYIRGPFNRTDSHAHEIFLGTMTNAVFSSERYEPLWSTSLEYVLDR